MKTPPPWVLRDRSELDFLLVLPWFARAEGETSFPVMAGVGAEFPYSMTVLLAHLERSGLSTGLLDLTLEPEPLAVLETVLRVRRPSVVGVSCYTSNVRCAEVVGQTIKRLDPDLPTVLGGFHATAMPEECLRQYDCFDYVMHGECELSLVTFLSKLLNHESPVDTPNLVYRSDGNIIVNPPGPVVEDLGELPFPLLDRVDPRRYRPLPVNFWRLPTIGVIFSRGCPFKCTFCATHFQWNGKMRKMSVERSVECLQRIVTDSGIRDFRFYDDTFTIPRRSAMEFCEELLRRKLEISWNCYSRVDTIDRSMAVLMKRAGCYHMKFGVEAGTQESLRRIRKDISLAQALESVRMVKKVGIEVKASFILGIDGETLAEAEKTVDFACRLAPDFATFLVMMIYPGSEDYETHRKRGLIPNDFRWDRPLYANQKDTEQLRAMAKDAYRRFYLRPRFFVDRLSHFARHPIANVRRAVVAARYVAEKHLRGSHIARTIGDRAMTQGAILKQRSRPKRDTLPKPADAERQFHNTAKP